MTQAVRTRTDGIPAHMFQNEFPPDPGSSWNQGFLNIMV